MTDVLARLVQRLLWLPLGYLAAVTLAGVRSPARVGPGAGALRFVVVVPARNEERVITQTLQALTSVDYPAERRRVIVIADDCTDRTVELARAAGAEVWERTRPEPRGKGAALGWACEQLLSRDGWDALVVVDADTVVDPAFFRTVERRLAEGAEVVQGRYDVSNADASAVARLAQVSFAVQSVLRPRGRAALGAAAKLQGNGMAFSRAVLERQPWSGEGLAEDVDYWLKLVRAGVHPRYEPAAVVFGAMPTDVQAARVQRFRWEAGRAALARRHLLPALRQALRTRDPVLAEAVVSELAFPPLATTSALVAAAGVARSRRRGRAVALAQAAVLAAHAVAALRVARAPRSAYAALALAPAAVVWKVVVKLETMRRGREAEWTTTPRR